MASETTNTSGTAPVEVKSKGGMRVALNGRSATIAKALLIIVLLVWPLIYRNQYGMSVMTQAGLFTIVTISVGLVLGTAGQLSFGHSAFYGVGAYTCGLLVSKFGVPTFVALIAGAVAAGFVALVVGRPVLKLKYFYLALATMGLGQIFLAIVNEVKWVGGSHGFGGVDPLNLFGLELDSYIEKYYMVWIIAVIILLFTARLLKYRSGRALRALAVSEIASSTLGVRNSHWKMVAFVTGAIYCGIAGGLLAFSFSAVAPGSFTFAASVLPIVMMLIGGDRSVYGCVLGAVIMTWVVNGFSGIQEYSGTVYSVIMILLLLFLPAGILGFRPKQRRRLWALIKGESLEETVACAAAAEADQETTLCTAQMPLPAAPAETAASVEAAATETASDVAQTLREDLARQRKEQTTSGPLLRIEDVCVYFGGLKAVDHVSFDVAEGSITALIGPNGAGKTTLFNAISRLQPLTEGRILLGDQDLTKLDAADTARLGVARTFQNLRIFVNMSVLENVLVGCHRHEKSGFWADGLGLPSQRRQEAQSRARAMDALALVGLTEQALLPAASLPYGQQRLVEIARALASEPRLLLLDEPAAGMNAAEREDLVRRITAIREAGVTVLLVEHDIDLVMDISNAVNVLNYGKLIASGTPEEVRKDEGVITAYLGVEREQVDICATRDLINQPCENMLVVEDVAAAYGSIEALHGVSFIVPKGQVVAVLGANGAGKTTLLNTICGVVRCTRGHVYYQGSDITRMPTEKIAARGLCQVPEGRQLFPSLSVEDNLLVGATCRRDKTTLADDIAYVYELFPILGERRKQEAGTLSGGEQQMLAIGRALAGQPSLLLLDEPSMGLAPLVVERIFEALAQLNKQGLTMLMVEQNAEMALSLAHFAVVLQTGNVTLSGAATVLRQDDRVRASYLGG